MLKKLANYRSENCINCPDCGRVIELPSKKKSRTKLFVIIIFSGIVVFLAFSVLTQATPLGIALENKTIYIKIEHNFKIDDSVYANIDAMLAKYGIAQINASDVINRVNYINMTS